MAGANKNFVLGKGRFYFERFAAGATTGAGEEYIAQTREGAFSVSSETLEHYDADEGLNVLDEQVTTQVDVTGNFSVENITLDVLSKFLLADGATSVAVTSATGATSTFNNVKRGRYFQLGKSTALPQGARNVSNVSIALASVPGTPLTNTNNVNWEVDAALGRVFLKADSPAIADDDDIIVTFDVASGTREIVVSKDQQLRGALRFISANPVGGQRDFYFPLVNLSPDGDFALKGEDWQTVSFNFTALKLDATTERVYIDGRSV